MKKQKKNEQRTPDISERLLTLTAKVMSLSASLPDDRVGAKVTDELTTLAMLAYRNHGLAEGSPSAKEFAEKFRDVLKNLREIRRTLHIVEKVGFPCDGQTLRELLEETDLLIRIFFSSIRTLESRGAYRDWETIGRAHV